MPKQYSTITVNITEEQTDHQLTRMSASICNTSKTVKETHAIKLKHELQHHGKYVFDSFGCCRCWHVFL